MEIEKENEIERQKGIEVERGREIERQKEIVRQMEIEKETEIERQKPRAFSNLQVKGVALAKVQPNGGLGLVRVRWGDSPFFEGTR